MTVVITGSSTGIGASAAMKFLREGHRVVGIDKDTSRIMSPSYTHFQYDITGTEKDFSFLPYVNNCEILVNNAGVQNSGRDIDVNLRGLMNCTEVYAMHPGIKSVVNIASVSAHNGAEFPEYCASKGGVLAYTVNTSKRIAQWGATCNSLSFGGVTTDLNKQVIEDSDKWAQIMEMTPLKKWATPEECAEWIYFVSVINKSMTGQDIIIDNGEMKNHTFVW